MSTKEIHIYSDESRHRAHRFMLLGGLWILKEKISNVEQVIYSLREAEGYTKDGKWVPFRGEFKWTKVSNKHVEVYKKLVDIFFESMEKSLIRCCIMLVDTHDEEILRHDNIKRDGFYKLLYQLYLHNCRVPGKYWIYPDQITNPTHHVNLKTLEETLEYSLLQKFSSKIPPDEILQKIVQEIKPIDSKKVDLLQMLDVVMGALGYFQNRFFEIEGASPAKTEIMKHVMDKIIYSGALKYDGKQYIVVKSTRFNIWLFKPRKQK